MKKFWIGTTIVFSFLAVCGATLMIWYKFFDGNYNFNLQNVVVDKLGWKIHYENLNDVDVKKEDLNITINKKSYQDFLVNNNLSLIILNSPISKGDAVSLEYHSHDVLNLDTTQLDFQARLENIDVVNNDTFKLNFNNPNLINGLFFSDVYAEVNNEPVSFQILDSNAFLIKLSTTLHKSDEIKMFYKMETPVSYIF